MQKFAAAAIAVLLTTACAAVAQDEAPTPPPPPGCATDASPYRDFDFWVGHWDVYDPDGNFAGENLISLREGGCLILEEWTGSQGGSGTSMNFYDPAVGAWRQVWQSAGAFIDYTGALDDGSMALEGAITYNRTGLSAPFRGRWTEQDDGSVLQEFWQYNSETDVWDVWFVGEYRRKEAAGAPEDE